MLFPPSPRLSHCAKRARISRARNLGSTTGSDIARKEFFDSFAGYAETNTNALHSAENWGQFAYKRQEVRQLIDAFTPYGSSQQLHSRWKPRDGLRNPTREATISALLASGAHFGHAATRMNPNFMPYAYGERSGITIIDLDQTLPLLRRAANVVRAVAMSGGSVLFLGTRPDLAPIVERAAERVKPFGFYIGDRWLPGALSNRNSFFGEDMASAFQVDPDLVVILNPSQNTTAMAEFAQHHIPTIGVIDTNFDPRIVMYPIPANDESTRTAELICGVLSIAGREGVNLARMMQKQLPDKGVDSGDPEDVEVQ